MYLILHRETVIFNPSDRLTLLTGSYIPRTLAVPSNFHVLKIEQHDVFEKSRKTSIFPKRNKYEI